MSSLYLADELFRLINEEYDIGKVGSIEALTDFSSSVLRTEPLSLWKVTTSMGSFCLKTHRRSKSQERIAFEECFQLTVNNTEPHFSLLPRICTRKNGLRHFVYFDTATYLEQFMPGKHYKWWLKKPFDEQVVAEAGRALACFHNAALSVESNANLQRQWAAWNECESAKQRTSNLNHSSSVYSTVLNTAQALVHSPSAPATIDHLIKRLASALPTFSQLISSLDADRNMELELFVHGDFHSGNVLFVGNAPSAILDFEYVRRDHPGFDLGYALSMFCRGGDDGNKAYNLDCRLAQTLLCSYVSSCAPYGSWVETPEGKKLVYMYVYVAAVMNAAWLLTQYAHLDDEKSTPNADSRSIAFESSRPESKQIGLRTLQADLRHERQNPLQVLRETAEQFLSLLETELFDSLCEANPAQNS